MWLEELVPLDFSKNERRMKMEFSEKDVLEVFLLQEGWQKKQSEVKSG